LSIFRSGFAPASAISVALFSVADGLFTLLKGQTMKNEFALPKFLVALVAMWSTPIHAADVDGRQLVDMPLEARAALRAEMLDFQTALHSIVAALAEQQFAAAADMAEKQMGLSAMGRHRDAPPNARPGMFMPNEMHAIARSMHAAGSDFASVAKSRDTAKALSSLQAVIAACVACHRTYRTQ
jgi:hypothetical protein